MTTLFRFLSWLPLWLLHAWGWLLGWLVFLSSGAYRRRLIEHVRQAGYGARIWIAAVGQAGMMTAELPRLWLGRTPRVVWDGAQHVEAALARGRGLLLLAPHLGCFEITGLDYARRYGAQEPMTVMFRPPRKPWLHSLVVRSREREGMLPVPANMSGIKLMLKALRDGQTVGLLPDQVPPQGLGVWAPFFGRPAYTMTLAARLAQQTGAAVLLIWGERLSFGRGYRVGVRPLAEELPADPAAAAAVVNRAMESVIAVRPQQYLWGYARYKQPREVGKD